LRESEGGFAAEIRKVEDKVNNLKGGHGTILFFEDKAGELGNAFADNAG
jgi:predicted oxidoreductase (fatty acid repression mutant protein)